jgi:hypothetical protein
MTAFNFQGTDLPLKRKTSTIDPIDQILVSFHCEILDDGNF